jgi:hypothetical protein
MRSSALGGVRAHDCDLWLQVMRGSTDQVDETGSSEPDADQRRNELAKPDAVGSFQDVEILKYVRDGHQSQCPCEPQTCAVYIIRINEQIQPIPSVYRPRLHTVTIFGEMLLYCVAEGRRRTAAGGCQ